MALARRGAETAGAIERRLHVGAAAAGHPVDAGFGLGEPGVALIRHRLAPSDLTTLREELARGSWVMVHVAGPKWVARLPAGIDGRHGPLCPPGAEARPIHSVLLVASSEASFFVLDPFHSPDGQPLEISDAEFLDVLLGFPSVAIEK